MMDLCASSLCFASLVLIYLSTLVADATTSQLSYLALRQPSLDITPLLGEFQSCATFIGLAADRKELFSSEDIKCFTSLNQPPASQYLALASVTSSHCTSNGLCLGQPSMLFSLDVSPSICHPGGTVAEDCQQNRRDARIAEFLSRVDSALEQRQSECVTAVDQVVDSHTQQLVLQTRDGCDGARLGRKRVRKVLPDVDGQPFSTVVQVPNESIRVFLDLCPPDIYLVAHPIELALNRTGHLSTLDSLRVSANRLRHQVSRIGYSAKVDRLAGSLDPEALLRDVATLSGEPGSGADWMTRHSFSEGGVRAAHWLKGQFEQTGAECELDEYQTGVSPNLVCGFRASLNASSRVSASHYEQPATVVLSAHYDSRSTFGFVSAPGADNDASGCAILLSIARAIHSSGLTLADELVFVAFSGTEQGLWGSRSLARKWREDGKEVLLSINANMISYRVPGEPMQIAFPKFGASEEATEFVKLITNIYVPELLPGTTSIESSDESSFQSMGFPSTRVFERNGYNKNPNYLKQTDRWDDKKGYDVIQTMAIGKALFASVLSLSYVDV